jgi:hypothetical protein
LKIEPQRFRDADALEVSRGVVFRDRRPGGRRGEQRIDLSVD